jgi:phosphoribosylaminoimidazole-succinocarboxamide synthase
VLNIALEQEAKAPVVIPATKKETKKSKSSKGSATAVTADKKESMKSVVFKGKSPVDDACPIKDQVCFIFKIEMQYGNAKYLFWRNVN